MKRLLMSAAVIALASGSAFATDLKPIDNVQINLGGGHQAPSVLTKRMPSALVIVPIGGSGQNATTLVTDVLVGDKLSVSNQAVGNALSIEDLNVALLNVQGNVDSRQISTVSLNGVGAAGAISVESTAVGSTANVDGGTVVPLKSLQINVGSPQIASSGLGLVGTKQKLEVTTVAVGNALNVADVAEAGSHDSFVIQANVASGQTALASVGLSGAKSLEATTQAVGNSASISSHGDVALKAVGQINIGSPQTALFSNGLVFVPGEIKVETAAVGNSLSVQSGGNATVGKALLSGQANFASPQFASTDLGTNWAKHGYDKVTVNTVAAGNTASFEGADVKVGGGLFVQANVGSGQTATTVFSEGGIMAFAGWKPNQLSSGPVKLTTAAVGNSLDIGAHSVDATVVQVNAFSPQTATTVLGSGGLHSVSSIGPIGGISAIGGPVAVTTQAVGNSTTIKLR